MATESGWPASGMRWTICGGPSSTTASSPLGFAKLVARVRRRPARAAAEHRDARGLAAQVERAVRRRAAGSADVDEAEPPGGRVRVDERPAVAVASTISADVGVSTGSLGTEVVGHEEAAHVVHGVVGEEAVQPGGQEGADLADQVADRVGIGAARNVGGRNWFSRRNVQACTIRPRSVGVADHRARGGQGPAASRGISAFLHAPIPSA